jgi:uncharacterized cofD-like protein
MVGQKRPRVVVIGGGTGSFVVLSGLKQHDVELSAVVTVADSGGSTGRLRSEFGFLPVGDIRQCLAALAKDNGQNYIRDLLLYRFAKGGKGLTGHNLGNLILTALTDLTGSEPKAIETASRIFRLQGKVYPVSLDTVDLVATYEDGTQIVGEHEIDEPGHKGGKRIVALASRKPAKLYSQVEQAILAADLVVLCPGDLYTSLLPNLIIQGMSQALKKTRARLVYVMNLMTRYAQTHGLTAAGHVAQLEHYTRRRLNRILVNSTPVLPAILRLYEREKGFPVADDLGQDRRVMRQDLLDRRIVTKPKGDQLKRSLVRHDPTKVAEALIKLLQ